MTIRRFNYTGCQRIPRDRVTAVIDDAGNGPVLAASFDLSELALPGNAEVVIEAYADWTVMRFSYGSIADPQEPSSTLLAEFDSTEGIRLRLKVLGTGEHAGRILAEADAIRPSAPEEASSGRSFVSVRPSDLGAVVWQLSFDEAQPLLLVNDRLGDWKSFLGNGGVRALVLPEILRQLLSEAVQRGVNDESEDWINQCARAAHALGFPEMPASSDDDSDEWVDGVVRVFAQRHRLWGGLEQLLDPEGRE